MNWKQLRRDALTALTLFIGAGMIYAGILLALGRPLW